MEGNMQSITYRDDNPELEESFSFSSCGACDLFNSSSSFQFLFSGDNNNDYISNDESYIEIALQPTTPTGFYCCHNSICHGNEDEEKMEVRISFSSTAAAPFPFQHQRRLYSKTEGVETHESSVINSTPSSSSTMFTFPSSVSTSSDHQITPSDAHQDVPVLTQVIMDQSSLESRRMQSPSLLQRFVNTLLPRFRSSENHGGLTSAAHANRLQLLQPRAKKECNDFTTNGGGITKFSIRFPSMKLRVFVASLNKTHRSLMKSFGKWLMPSSVSSTSNNLLGISDQMIRSKAIVEPEINMDAIKGVIKASRRGLKDRKREGSPRIRCSSNSTSPLIIRQSCNNIHHNPNYDQNKIMCAPDNSIQAAIAYCKRSLLHPYV